METNNETYRLVAKTMAGLEEVLAEELEQIGAKNIEKQVRAVIFDGDKAMMYRANYHLRTSISVLKPIYEFIANNEDELYKHVGKVNWSKYMTVDETLAISAATSGEIFTHSKYISQKVKDAIVDQFRRRQDKRPDVNTLSPDLKINIHIHNNKCSLLLDSSGDPLFKRGYRIKATKAPVNEVLAAGMIKLSGWNMDCDFYDPMCGSGTLLIEAALMAYGIAPGTYRKKFGFESWNDFDADLFEEITEETYGNTEFAHNIYGSDLSPLAVKIAEENIGQAFLRKKISVTPANFFDIQPKGKGGFMVTNPPYGERLQPDDLKMFYQKIGDKLKIDFTGFTSWIIGSNAEVMKFIGLKPERKIKLYNGSLECTFRKFSVYEGSKRNGEEPNDENL
ncbi:MAG: RNA methyltransferase [Salinivirgaceae bacterium]|nr:RNA methyltransferase [Salinivirgaceae bacterium]